MFYVLIGLFMLSWSLTWSVRRYALTKNIMDLPNHRSSHALPTPRGGGLAFVITFLVTIPLLVHLSLLTFKDSWALMGAGSCIAVLGFCDDHRHVPARWRLCGHFVASILAVYWLGGMPSISLFGIVLPTTLLADGLAIIYLVWLLNLYNFMDGIDGLAGMEAMSICLGVACIYWLGGNTNLMILPLLLAVSVAGFLFWNIPPARIFMGDVGSGFLGFILGALSIQAAHINKTYFWVWLILLGVFIVDATCTLSMRAIQGAKIYEAHRSHAYQRAALHFGNHLRVTLVVLMINVMWLFPIAVLVSQAYLDGAIGLLIAYGPLVILALYLKAGKAD